jgi:dihydroorotase
LRSAAEAGACLEGVLDGTVDAVATDHAPHSQVDKDVEFGLARPGIAGIETALGLLLEAVDAGLLPLARAIAALTVGPARVLAPTRGLRSLGGPPALIEGALADLVVFDRAARWSVEPGSLRTRGWGNPLNGRSLPGPVLLTVAGGRLAYEADERS